MSKTVQSLTAQCKGCGAEIRRNSLGMWRDRTRANPSPWSCVGGKPHQPQPGTLK